MTDSAPHSDARPLVGSVEQSVHLSATPDVVFAKLTDAEQHAQLVGYSCHVDSAGRFSVGADMISGVNRQLDRPSKIVQSWRIDLPDWPSDHYSTVVIELSPERGGTRLNLTHTGIPEPCVAAVDAGWHEFYWIPLGAAHPG